MDSKVLEGSANLIKVGRRNMMGPHVNIGQSEMQGFAGGGRAFSDKRVRQPMVHRV